MQQQADLLARIVQGIHDPTAGSGGSRNAADNVFTQLKTGDLGTSSALAAALLEPARAMEVQHFGLSLLQHLVTQRWHEFAAADQAQLANIATGFLQQTWGQGSAWAIRSKAAVLLALITNRRGSGYLEQLLPQLLAFAQQSPAAAQMVCMVLQQLAEEVTQFNEDLGQEQRRALLSALIGALDPILPFLCSTIQSSLAAALDSARRQDVGPASAHGSVVQAACEAAGAYTEWPPLGRIASSGLIAQAAILLASPDFQASACSLLRQLLQRRQGHEAADVYGAVMGEVGVALLRAGSMLLAPNNIDELGPGGRFEDNAFMVVDAMATFGSEHLLTVADSQHRDLFLQQMLAFSQHSSMRLANQALPIWTELLKTPKARAPTDHAPAAKSPAVSLACASALLDVAGSQLQRGLNLQETDDIPDFLDDFKEYKEFCVSWRGQLTKIVHMAAGLLPLEALQAADRRLSSALACCSSPASNPEDQHVQLEAAVHFLGSVANAAAASSLQQPQEGQAEQRAQVSAGLKQLLSQVLGPTFQQPRLLVLQVRALEGFSSFLSAEPSIMPPVLSKAFDMFVSFPLEGDPKGAPPPNPWPEWKERHRARQIISNMLLVYSKEAPLAMMPHLAQLAQRIEQGWASGLLWAGERNVLMEALLAVAAHSPDPAIQSQAAEWALREVREVWGQADWQRHLASPEAFASHYTPLETSASGPQAGGALPRWHLFHHLHLVERAIIRLAPPLPTSEASSRSQSGPSPAALPNGAPPATPSAVAHEAQLQPNGDASSACSAAANGAQALQSHLAWAASAMLRLLQCLHSLWLPQVQSALQPLASAFGIGPRERASLLKRSVSKEEAEEEAVTLGGTSAAALRSWLRMMRELLYHGLGCMIEKLPAFYDLPRAQALFPSALAGHLDVMWPQHIKLLLRHIVIPLFKQCPHEHRQAWLVPPLQELLPYMHARLTNAWAGITKSSKPATEAAAEAEQEIVEEFLLRELTQQYLSFLDMLLRSPGSTEEWLMQPAPAAADAAMAVAVAALSWPDDSSAVRAASVCRAIAAWSVQQPGMQQRVGQDMLRGAVVACAHLQDPAYQAEPLNLLIDLLLLPAPASELASQELLRLPRITPEAVAQCRQALQAEHGVRDRRMIMKKFLGQSGASLREASREWRSTRISNVSEPNKRIPKQAGFNDDNTFSL
ncbi:hypothetical protein WJX74_009906 [Apatococcus lobatus]|uniref:Uncharacterized protein n=1 Tax=Apatococcus lobatus TaxID=904363 RepID=A0AAW1QW74_9CHLO